MGHTCLSGSPDAGRDWQGRSSDWGELVMVHGADVPKALPDVGLQLWVLDFLYVDAWRCWYYRRSGEYAWSLRLASPHPSYGIVA